MENFKIGQKVVCIMNFINNPISKYQAILPMKGKIYTIRKIEKDDRNRIGIWLEEIINKPIQHRIAFGEQGFISIGFRPLKYSDVSAEIVSKFKITEEKSDIEINEEVLCQ